MALRPPRVWSLSPGESTAAKLLAPLGVLYHCEVQRRLKARSPLKPGAPVICVGNVTMGGVGKTPFVRMLGERLLSRGIAVHILTRGYGGTEQGPLRVSQDSPADEVGDEPLMLASSLPVWISKDRAKGAEAAVAAGAELLIMDDGFQNPSIAKDLSFLLVDAETLFANGAVFPAGPLREKPQTAWSRCDAVAAMLPSADHPVPEELKAFSRGKPLLAAWFDLDSDTVPDAPLLAFCGIGHPERFFHSLQRSGADLIDQVAFPDHHVFTEADLQPLHRDAARLGAQLVTTEKDACRLSLEQRQDIAVARGTMRVRNETALYDVLKDIL